jgi:hypothetical protein
MLCTISAAKAEKYLKIITVVTLKSVHGISKQSIKIAMCHGIVSTRLTMLFNGWDNAFYTKSPCDRRPLEQ